jgi:hypothetical protein
LQSRGGKAFYCSGFKTSLTLTVLLYQMPGSPPEDSSKDLPERRHERPV